MTGSGAPAMKILPSSATLYAGDLDPNVDEKLILKVFGEHGNVSSVRLCRDRLTGDSLRYAYVNFCSRSEAEKALKSLNHTALKGKPMRIMWSLRNPILRKSGEGNVFVKNLDSSIDGAKLEEIFSTHGEILSSKVATDEDGRSKCYGFVQFQTEKSAQAAIEALNGSQEHGTRKLYVAKFVRKSLRPQPDFPKSSTVFIKNLDESITETLIQESFLKFGAVRKVKIVKNEAGAYRGFGFVSFERQDEAKSAIAAMNRAQIGSRTVYVGKAMSRAERARLQRQRSGDCHDNQVPVSEIFVKNLHPSVDEKALREIFAGCGRIRTATVVCDGTGASRGFGFVGFHCPDEAWTAVSAINGAVFMGKRLKVEAARKKENQKRAVQSFAPETQTTSPSLTMAHQMWMNGYVDYLYGIPAMNGYSVVTKMA
ncbi:polyadenylate-binding protein 7-like isoform X2 [Wolffia australiana]